MSVVPAAPASGARSPVRRRLPWLIVGFLVLVVIGCAVWALRQTSDLSSATDARDRAAVLLTRSRGAERDAADRLADKRQSATSPATSGHQIVDLERDELDLATQTSMLSRQSIQAALNENADAYNAANDQFNALSRQANELVSQINTSFDKLLVPPPSPTA